MRYNEIRDFSPYHVSLVYQRDLTKRPSVISKIPKFRDLSKLMGKV